MGASATAVTERASWFLIRLFAVESFGRLISSSPRCCPGLGRRWRAGCRVVLRGETRVPNRVPKRANPP
jgi:hypothetical protein